MEFSFIESVYPSNKHIEFDLDSRISEKRAKLHRMETIIKLEI